jgi:DNA-directed RNA polymerase II subunit RPB2
MDDRGGPVPLVQFVHVLGGPAALAACPALLRPDDDHDFRWARARAGCADALRESFRRTLAQVFDPALPFCFSYRDPDQPPGLQNHVLDTYLLPHLGVEPADRAQKAYWLLRWARELIEARHGMREPTDRDALWEKRVRINGEQMEDLFRRVLAQFWSSLRKDLQVQLKKKRQIDFPATINRNTHYITKHLHRAIATGIWRGDVKSVTCSFMRDQSQALAISNVRSIHHPMAHTGRQMKPRMLHGSQYGFVCPSETPASETIGYTKHPAITAEISTRGKDRFWLTQMRALCRPGLEGGTRAILNGRIVGVLTGPADRAVLALRRLVPLHPPWHTVVHVRLGELHVETAPGRYVRPLFVLPLRPAAPGASFAELIHAGAVEFVDPAQDVVVAWGPAAVTPLSTHMELHPSAMFGYSAGRIPYADHNPGTRNTFQAEMGPQAQGLNALHPRFDKTFHALDYPQAPLASTLIERLTDPLPSNCNVVMMIYPDAFAQEDSLVIKRSALDFGMLRSVTHKTYDVVAAPPFRFAAVEGHPKVGPDGCVAPGTRLSDGDVMCCKVHGSQVIAEPFRSAGQVSGIVHTVMRTTDSQVRLPAARADARRAASCSASWCASRAACRSGTSSRRATARRARPPSSCPRRTCPSPARASRRTSCSTRTPSPAA